jgi:hypothetical protein
LFVFGGMLGLVAVCNALGVLDHAPGWLVGSGVGILMLPLIAAALWLFHPKGSDPLGRQTAEEHLRELDRLGLLESTEFRALRAFGVEEYEDEGLHYFLELVDGSVLFLSGQYLYDYEPITDDPDVNQPRSFPCSEFTVRRHKNERYVAEIACGGSVLEPEVMAPPFGKKVWSAGGVPEDGRVFPKASYEDLKRERTRHA